MCAGGGQGGGLGKATYFGVLPLSGFIDSHNFLCYFREGGRYFREGDCSFQKFTVALWVMAVLEPYYYAPVPKIIAVRIVKCIITWKNTFLLAL